MVADRRTRDVLTGLHNVSGEVAAHYRARDSAAIHVYEQSKVVCTEDDEKQSSVRFQSVGFWAIEVVLMRTSLSPTGGTGWSLTTARCP